MSDSTSIIAYVGLAISVGGVIIGAINHKRLRSNCFGREAVVSLDIDNTTPPKLKVSVPEDKSSSSAIS